MNIISPHRTQQSYLQPTATDRRQALYQSGRFNIKCKPGLQKPHPPDVGSSIHTPAGSYKHPVSIQHYFEPTVVGITISTPLPPNATAAVEIVKTGVS